MTKLWVVVCEGGHEAECVYSVWTTRRGAKAEVDRLYDTGVQRGCYDGDFSVVTITADTPSEVWIG